MDKLVQFFLSKNIYDDKPTGVKHYETHISHVFVGGNHAYKVKKAVKFDFLDFSTLKKRLQNCKREVLLNSRLAKGYYLGIVKIYQKNGVLSLKKTKNSKVFDYAVKMKRIPETKILSNQIEDGALLLSEIKTVTRKIATFHRQSLSYTGKYYGGRAAVRKDNQENIEEISPYIDKTITKDQFEMINAFVFNFINNNKKLFIERKASGFIKEIHGDLHTNHIVLAKQIIIFDCIEFNKRLSIGDVLEDIAFLLMDLEFKGRFDLSNAVYKTYFKHNVYYKNDELLRFYKVYRAVVRGKIESLTYDAVDKSQKNIHYKKACDYFSLACHYILKNKMSFNPLILMGVSGAGKSSVTKFFLDRATILRSDVIRKEISNIKINSHLYSDIETGIYSKQVTENTYKKLLELTIKNCLANKKVIVDATFLKIWQRKLFLDTLLTEGFNPLFIYLTAPEDLLIKRVLIRQKEGKDVSDADVKVLQHQLKTIEQPDEIPSYRILKIKTVNPPELIAKNIQELF